MTCRGDSTQLSEALTALDAHGVYLSEADEAEMIRRVAATDDVGEFSLRTSRCGVRLDGFDAYWERLREVFSKAP